MSTNFILSHFYETYLFVLNLRFCTYIFPPNGKTFIVAQSEQSQKDVLPK